MRNFDYIKDLDIPTLYRYCSAAEEFQVSNPDMSAVNARRALEYIVRALYEMKNIPVSEYTSLFELVDGEPFREFIGSDRVMMAVHYVRKVGNNGAHDGKVSRKESFFALLNIYNVVGAVLLKLQVVDEVRPFDKTLIPDTSTLPPITTAEPATIIALPTADIAAVESDEPVAEMATDISEAETRKLYIDLMLKEAGWEVLTTEKAIQPLKACIEVELHGMPNARGVGYADYVLFGSDGMPLAVIEAKRTSVSPAKGKHQAELYADCLETQYGRRPIIYYTNGFENWIIDGLGYPPRRLYGFHTADNLESMIQRRGRHDISDFSVKPEITNRPYQKMAIKAVCEHFNKKHRKGLLVMATGTGKTRVAISLTDVLTLKTDIAPLLQKNTLDEGAKKFDILVLMIELSSLDSDTDATKCIQKVRLIAECLHDKASLPQVLAKIGDLKEVLQPAAFDNASLQWLEKVRNDRRDLMKFLVGDKGQWFVVDINDVISDDGVNEGVLTRGSYKQRIIDFLRENRDLHVLRKIYNIEQLSLDDIKELERILWQELGNKEEYDRYTSDIPYASNVAAFIRSLTGIDSKEAVRKFGDFITDAELNSEQEDFLMTIVNHVCENGDITKDIVVNDALFDERLVVFLPLMIPLRNYVDNIHNVIIPQRRSERIYVVS